MKKTINVNLNGQAFTIDEDAYRLLDSYFRNLKIYFRKEEGVTEIIADFEARIGELLDEKIRLGYQVISIPQVEEVIARMGKPTDFSEETTASEKQSAQPEDKGTEKKFFRNPENKKIGGVCSGISAYFGWDVLPVRIIFFILIFVSYALIIPAYLLIWILAPEAKTAEQKLQMCGKPITLENIGKAVASEIEESKEKNKHKTGFIDSLVEFIGAFLKICFVGLSCLLGLPILFALIVVVFVLLSILFGIVSAIDIAALLPWWIDPMVSIPYPTLTTVTFILLLLIPLAAIVYGIIAYFAKLKPMKAGIRWLIFGIWVLVLTLFLCSRFKINVKYFRNIDYYSWHQEEIPVFRREQTCFGENMLNLTKTDLIWRKHA
jgi:phage shock protein PspC (stress-responsive transcriptional regulator)